MLRLYPGKVVICRLTCVTVGGRRVGTARALARFRFLAPQAALWLSLDGLEDPAVEPLALTCVNPSLFNTDVRFTLAGVACRGMFCDVTPWVKKSIADADWNVVCIELVP